MHITVSRHVLLRWSAKVDHLQQGVSSVRMAKCMLKEFKVVSEVSSTSPKVRIWSFLKMAMRFTASLATAPLFCTHWSRCRLRRVVAALWLSVFTCVFAPVLQLFFTPSHHNFLPFWYREKWHHKHCYSVGNDKCTQVFVNKTFNCILIWDECLRTSHTFNCIL